LNTSFTNREDIDFSSFKRILIKVGTSVVANKDHTAALARVAATVEQIVELKNFGKEVILVSSGAIGLGSKALIDRRPGVYRNQTAGLNGSENAEKRACAAIGQARLMTLYEMLFNHKNVSCSQILLTNQDLKNDQMSRLAETCNLLLDMDVVPILNENDVTNVKEPQTVTEPLKSHDKSIISDNDALACKLACNLGVDLVVLLTDVDGVYTCPPSMPGAKIISSIKQSCNGVTTSLPDGSSGGTGRGGMAAKIHAVSGALDQVRAIIIANGFRQDSILRAVAGQTVGTLIAKSSASVIPAARL